MYFSGWSVASKQRVLDKELRDIKLFDASLVLFCLKAQHWVMKSSYRS